MGDPVLLSSAVSWSDLGVVKAEGLRAMAEASQVRQEAQSPEKLVSLGSMESYSKEGGVVYSAGNIPKFYGK
jgi:hypothetical protein